MAVAVGKPLQVDLAIKNQTILGCARVKVKVDLLRDFPKRINIGLRRKTGEIVEKWITINYDHVPKYCNNCKIWGYDEQGCYVLHLELYPKMEEAGETYKKKAQAEKEEDMKQGKITKDMEHINKKVLEQWVATWQKETKSTIGGQTEARS